MKKKVRLNMAGALVKFLIQQYIARDGVEHRLINGVFGIFGHGNVTGFGQALEELGGDTLPFYQPKTEQAMVHSATAYAKARRRLGALACTTSVGPGATNLLTGAATATVNRLPVLLLPGDIFANRVPSPVLQQLEYPGSQDVSVNDCFRPVSKYWDRINRPEQILTALPEAMRILCDPAETGAVTIAMPEDVQAESYDYPGQFFQKRVYIVERPLASTETLAMAAAALKSAKRPFIIAGGGVHYSDACEALEAFSRAASIPVACTQAGMGAVLDANPLSVASIGVTGGSAANELARSADVVLCIGTRLSDFTTASKSLFQAPGVRFIGINIHSADARKHGAIPLWGDARAVINQLAGALGQWKVPPSYSREVAKVRTSWQKARAALVAPAKPGTLTQAEVIGAVNEACGTTGTVVHAAGGIPGDIHKLWRSQDAADYHSEYGYSCMGYEIAGALGVKLADPTREVYAFLGDGSYLMLHTEIVTAVQEGIKITIILNDNHGYGCIHNLQRGSGGKSFGNEFRSRDAKSGRLTGPALPVDFIQNARSLGATTLLAKTVPELRDALTRARAEKNTVFIYVPIDGEAKLPGFAWWDVPMSDTSAVSTVRQARKNYDKAKLAQNYYY